MEITIKKPFAINEIGERVNNQDYIYPKVGETSDSDMFFIVCDGIGGYDRGDIASRTVCDSLRLFLSDKTVDFSIHQFEQAIKYAYNQLDEADDDLSEKKMGTTLAFLYLHAQGAFVAHIGDSRIYHLRKTDEGCEVLYQSFDHSFVADLVRSGLITWEQAAKHPKRNIITRAMQAKQNVRSQPTLYQTNDIKAGDYFVLCTDGILEQVDTNLLQQIIGGSDDDQFKFNALIENCIGKTNDNFSAFLVPIKTVVSDFSATLVPSSQGARAHDQYNPKTDTLELVQAKYIWIFVISFIVSLLLILLYCTAL